MAAGGNTLNAVLVFGGDASQAVASVNKLNGSLGKLNTFLGNLNSTAQKSQRTFAGFTIVSGMFKSMYNGAQKIADSFRLAAQGIMSIGRAITFFVSIPLTAFFVMGSQSALDFEDQMIRVGKTTGLAGDALAYVEQRLRDIAKRAPTTHQQLGEMAEAAGQLGITSPEAIATFVEWMEILSVTTDVAADTIVTKMGKIAAAFGWNLNESTNEIIQLSNVINKLENDTAASADEIISALFRFAPEAEMLQIAAYDAAALAAALISVGVGAESAGTRMGTMLIQLTQNADKIAEMASGTEKYADKQAVLTAINDDAVGVLFDLMEMMTGTDNRAVALAQTFDLLGLRGGRAFSGLSTDQKRLIEVLAIARKEWSEHSSLVEEYNRALESSKNQLAILKNNITDVAVTLGKTFLPILNKAITIIIPAVRRLADAFTALSEKQKLIVAGIAMLIIVGGPLIFMLSQIAFGIAMMLLSVMKLAASLGSFIALIWKVVMAFRTFSLAAWGVIGVMAFLAVSVLKILQKMGVDIAGFFANLGARAVAWGENLSANIANGFLAGAIKYITKAINWVAQLIANFFEGHSPPKEGPLKHINRWGKTLIDTYFAGMKSADFDILSSIASKISGILQNFANIKLIGEDKQYKMLAKAREALAKLLADFRKTGKISESLLNNVVKGLGNAADEIKKLIRLELEYLQITQKLEQIEARRKQVQADYAKNVEDIAASGKTAEERVQLFRQAMRVRNNELRTLSKEEEELQKQKDAAKEQLDTMRAMIDAMQEQDDIQAKLLDTLEKMADAMKALGGAGGGGLEGLGEMGTGGLDLPTPEEIAEQIGVPIIDVQLRIQAGEKLLNAFLSGLKGETYLDLSGLSMEDMKIAENLFATGRKIHGVYLQILGTIERIKEGLSGAGDSGTGFFDKLKNMDTSWLTSIWDSIKSGFQQGFKPEVITELTKSFEFLKQQVLNFIETLKTPEAQKTLSAMGTVLGAIVKGLAWFLSFMVGTISAALTLVVTGLSYLIGAIITGVGFILTTLPKVGEFFFSTLPAFIVQGWKNIIAQITAVWQGLVSFLSTAWSVLSTNAVAGWNNLRTNVSAIVQAVIAYIISEWNKLTSGVSAIWKAITTYAITAWNNLKTNVGILVKMLVAYVIVEWNRLISGISNILNNIKTSIKNTFLLIVAIITTIISRVVGKVASVFSNIRDKIFEFFGIDAEIKARWAKIWEDVKLILTTVWGRIIGVFTQKRTEVTTQISTLKSAVISIFNSLIASVKYIFTTIWTVISGILTAIWTTITAVWRNILTAVRVAWYFILAIISSVVNTIWTTITTYFNAIVTTISVILTNIWTIITTVWQGILTTAQTIWDAIILAISTAVTSIWNVITIYFNAAKTIISAILSIIWTNIKSIWESIVATVTELVTSVVTTVVQKFTEVKLKAQTIWGLIKAAIATIWSDIVSAVTTELVNLYNVVTTKIQEVLDWIKGLWDTLVQIGRDIILGLIAGIQEKAKAFTEAFTKLIEDAIDAIKKKLGIGSPSKVGEDIGEDVVTGFVNGLNNGLSAMNNAIIGVTGAANLESSYNIGLVGTPALSGMGVQATSIGNIDIQISVGNVANQNDIKKIADEVIKQINSKLVANTAYGVARR